MKRNFTDLLLKGSTNERRPFSGWENRMIVSFRPWAFTEIAQAAHALTTGYDADYNHVSEQWQRKTLPGCIFIGAPANAWRGSARTPIETSLLAALPSAP